MDNLGNNIFDARFTNSYIFDIDMTNLRAKNFVFCKNKIVFLGNIMGILCSIKFFSISIRN